MSEQEMNKELKYYKILNKDQVQIISEATDLLEALLLLLEEAASRNCFPFNELHIVPIDKEEFDKIKEEIEIKNKRFYENKISELEMLIKEYKEKRNET